MDIRGAILVAVIFCAVTMSGLVTAHDKGGLDAYMEQGGVIDGIASMPFKSAADAIIAIPKLPGVGQPDDSLMKAGLISYPVSGEWHGYYMVFVTGSPYYPSVVQRQFVLSGNHVEVHTVILCEADAVSCEAVHSQFNVIDKKCGKNVPGCPGYAAQGNASQFPAELLPLLPPLIRPDDVSTGSPIARLARAMARNVQVSFACKDFIGGLTIYDESKKLALKITTRIFNGDESRALKFLEPSFRGVEDGSSNVELAEQFRKMGFSHDNAVNTCVLVVANRKDNIFALEKELANFKVHAQHKH